MIAYKITVASGKSYIGITKHTDPSMRVKDHRRSDRLLGRAIRKHGITSVEIIATAPTWDELCALEIQLIKEHKTKKPNGYNVANGGEGNSGWLHSKAVREKMSARMKGNKHLLGWDPSAETRRKWAKTNACPIKRRATSNALKEKWKDPVWSAKMREVLRKNNERKRNAPEGN